MTDLMEPTAPQAGMTSVERVLGTVELLEHILLDVLRGDTTEKEVAANMKTVLLAVRVNTQFRETITGSVNILRGLWMKPDESQCTEATTLNPLLTHASEARSEIRLIPNPAPEYPLKDSYEFHVQCDSGIYRPTEESWQHLIAVQRKVRPKFRTHYKVEWGGVSQWDPELSASPMILRCLEGATAGELVEMVKRWIQKRRPWEHLEFVLERKDDEEW